MKKFLLGAMLMLASFAVSAASVSIANPTLISGSGSVNSGVNAGIFYNNGTGFDSNSPLTVSWDAELSGTSDTLPVAFSFEGAMTSWEFSILENGLEIFSTGPFSGYQTVMQSIAMTPGANIYQLVLTGVTSSLGGFLANFAYPPTISEVPLPAAVWLFGSVLLGGLALRRRSKKANMQAVAA